MATNKSMMGLLERQVELLADLSVINKRQTDIIDELVATRKKVKEHIKSQRAQGGTDYGDEYVYDNKNKEFCRLYK